MYRYCALLFSRPIVTFTPFAMLLLFLALWLFTVLPATAGDLTPHHMGGLDPSPRARAWMATHAIHTTRVALNDIGWQRVNTERRAKGLPALDARLAVPRGSEAGNAGQTSPPPSSVDNTQLPYFPPIGDQAELSSCANFASTYYTMTHMVAMARNIDAQHGGDATHYSPKWTYNLVNGGEDNGASLEDCYQVMLDHGSASWQDFPYTGALSPPENYRAWCTDATVWRKAIDVRMNQVGSVANLDTDAGMTALKTLLANGYVLNFLNYIEDWKYKKIITEPGSTDNDPYLGQDACYYASNDQQGSHAMTVVGYNDKLWIDVNGNGKVDANEQGAFLIANSWGTGWGNNGFIWMSYDALKATSAVVNGPTAREPAWRFSQAYWLTARPTYTPAYTTRFTLHGANRDQLTATIGISSPDQTTPTNAWIPYALSGFIGGEYNFEGKNTGADDGNFVFDFTDLQPPTVPPALPPTRWHVQLSNTSAQTPCTITDMQVTDTAAAITTTARNIPQTAGATVDAYVDYPALPAGPQITKTVTPHYPSPGGTVTYTLAYVNAGTGVTGVKLTDVLPPHLTYVPGSATGGGIFSVGTDTIVWSLGTLANAAGGQCTFQAIVNADTPLGTVIANSATISCVESTTPVVSGIAAITVSSGGGRGDWWMFHHDPQHTGRSSFSGPSIVKQKWSFSTGEQVFSSPAIGQDGVIYIGSMNGSLSAVNPDGSPRWMFSAADSISSSPAIGKDGTVYVGSFDGNLYAINPDGSQQWAFPLSLGIDSSPVIGADGTIYVGGYDSNLYAINPDGSSLWTFTTTGSIFSSPAIGGDGVIYIGSEDKNFYAVNSNGTLKWAFATDGAIDSSPAIGADGVCYIGSNDHHLYAVKPDGTRKWAFTTGGEIWSSPVIAADGTIYVGSNDKNIYAVKPDGTQKWAFPTGEQVIAAPTIGADGTVYVGSDAKKLFAIAPNGTQKWVFTAGNAVRSSPALGTDGTLYVGSYDHQLYAITQGVAQPAFTLAKSVTPGFPSRADLVTYTIRYANCGTKAATKVRLIDTLPAHLTYLKGSITGAGSYDATTGTLSWSVGTLNIGAATAVTFQAIVNADAPLGQRILNTAVIGCAELPTSVSSSAAIFTVYSETSSRGDWWTFHHDTQHTGRSAVIGPRIAMQQWAFPTGDWVFSSPAFSADGTIYVGSNDANLYAVNPDGTEKWCFTTGDYVPSSPSIGLDGTIYVGSNDAHLYAINPDGSRQWAFPVDSEINASPVIGPDGTIYLGTTNGSLYALNPDGSQQWSYATKGIIFAAPALAPDGTIFVATDTLYALTAHGTYRWAFPTKDQVWSAPTIGPDGTIYVGSDDMNLYAITPAGKQKWAFTTDKSVSSTPALGANGIVYVGSEDGCLYAVDANGIQQWVFTTNGYITCSSPAIGADGVIYIGSDDANLYALNPNGVEKWVMTTGGKIRSSPALGENGTLYVGSCDGSLYAIGDSLPTIYTVTPSAGANGSINPATPQTVTAGNPVTFTGSANAGYTVDCWALDGKALPTGGGQYTLNYVIANHTVRVTFKALPTLTITPSAGANGTITPKTAQTVSYGSAITFTATANAGYTTDRWYIDGSTAQTSNARYLLANVTANHTVLVTFKPLGPLVVTPSAAAFSAITPKTAQTVSYGGSVAFTAVASTGYTIDSWLLDGTPVQTGGTTFLLNKVTANHLIKVTSKALGPYTVTATWGANGTASPKATQTIPYGGTVIFTESPNTGFTTDSWFLDGNMAQRGGTVFKLTNVTANHTVLITFEPLGPYTITPSAGAFGAITPKTAQTVAYGGAVTFSATASTGYTADVWSLDGVTAQQGGATYLLNKITADHRVKVTFKALGPYTVTATPGTNGSVSPRAPQALPYGGTVIFTESPNAGYTADSWYLDGNAVQAGGTALKLTHVTASHTVLVTFKLLPILVTPTAGANGTISPNSPQAVNYRGSVTFTATGNTGYAVDTWYQDGVGVNTGGSSYTLSNITTAHTVRVTFKINVIDQPDLTIGNSGETSYLGTGIFNTDGAGQTKSQSVTAGTTATYLFRVQNIGYTTESFLLTCPLPSASGWSAHVIDRGTGADLTTAITGTTRVTTLPIAPGVVSQYAVTVTPNTSVTSGTVYRLLITATAVHDSRKKDAVGVVTTRVDPVK